MSVELVVDNTKPPAPPAPSVAPPLVALVKRHPGDLWLKARKWARKIKPDQWSIDFSWRKNRCRVQHAEVDGHYSVFLQMLDDAGEPALYVTWRGDPEDYRSAIPLVMIPSEGEDGQWRAV